MYVYIHSIIAMEGKVMQCIDGFMHKKFYESGINDFLYNTCLNRKHIHMYIHIEDAVAIR